MLSQKILSRLDMEEQSHDLEKLELSSLKKRNRKMSDISESNETHQTGQHI